MNGETKLGIRHETYRSGKDDKGMWSLIDKVSKMLRKPTAASYGNPHDSHGDEIMDERKA